MRSICRRAVTPWIPPVIDREGAQATTETGSFEIPAPPKGLAISSLAMVEHLERGRC